MRRRNSNVCVCVRVNAVRFQRAGVVSRHQQSDKAVPYGTRVRRKKKKIDDDLNSSKGSRKSVCRETGTTHAIHASHNSAPCTDGCIPNERGIQRVLGECFFFSVRRGFLTYLNPPAKISCCCCCCFFCDMNGLLYPIGHGFLFIGFATFLKLFLA